MCTKKFEFCVSYSMFSNPFLSNSSRILTTRKVFCERREAGFEVILQSWMNHTQQKQDIASFLSLSFFLSIIRQSIRCFSFQKTIHKNFVSMVSNLLVSPAYPSPFTVFFLKISYCLRLFEYLPFCMWQWQWVKQRNGKRENIFLYRRMHFCWLYFLLCAIELSSAKHLHP